MTPANEKVPACACSSLADAFYPDEAPAGFIDSLQEGVYANGCRLCTCRRCGSLWAVDEWDKFAVQVVSRVRDGAHWESAAESGRKTALVRSRGGVGVEECVWKDCTGRRVEGSAYCIHHLYAGGTRR